MTPFGLSTLDIHNCCVVRMLPTRQVLVVSEREPYLTTHICTADPMKPGRKSSSGRFSKTERGKNIKSYTRTNERTAGFDPQKLPHVRSTFRFYHQLTRCCTLDPFALRIRTPLHLSVQIRSSWTLDAARAEKAVVP